MVQCPYCKVELDGNANFCSLCGEPLLENNEDNLVFINSRQSEQEMRQLTDYQRLTSQQKRRLFWKITGMVLLSILLITLIIDMVANRGVTWSKYPATISLVLIINTTLVVFWYKRTFLWLFLSFLSTSTLLILLDLYSHGTGWGIQLGIPLLLAAYITVLLLFRLIRRTNQKGMNVIAYSLIASGVLSMCIEGIISIYANDVISFEWSLIVMLSALVIAGLLLYVHFRLRRATDLRRFFHI